MYWGAFYRGGVFIYENSGAKNAKVFWKHYQKGF